MNEEIKEIDIKKNFYLCSPLLNKDCTKESCYINNGSCWHTVNEKYSQEHLLNYITNLQEKNQKLNKIIDELEKFLKEGQNLTCGSGITNEYIYAYENVLDKLIELKKGE